MLGSAVPAPATATIHTTTSSATPASPTRSSRLRGLSYLRNYTHNHLHSSNSRSDTSPLTRSTSSPEGASPSSADHLPPARAREAPRGVESTIQSGENGWLPTVQGRSGLSRDSLNPSSSTEAALPEPTNNISIVMTRNRDSTATTAPALTSSMAAMQARPPRTQFHSHDDRTSSTHALTALPEISSSAAATPTPKDPLPTIRFIPHLEARSSRPSLHFTAVSRTLKQPTSVVRVGRYSERDTAAANPSDRESYSVTPVGFKSKVVSRRHCEFWCTNGQWYVKDVKSSSGTFLNHVRLSSPGAESRPYPVNDGDVVQLGIDFKGGEELIFRCVKMRVECNRGWQKGLNTFNTSAHKRILKNVTARAGKKTGAKRSKNKPRDSDADAASTNSSECSICLNPVAPCQALFVAPCSHVWHYKCVRNLIQGPSYPNFLCPNCRFVADLDADVEQPEDFGVELFEGVEDEEEDEENGRASSDEEGGGSDTGGASHDDAELRSRQQDRGQEISEDELVGLLDGTSSQTLPASSAAASRSRSSDRRREREGVESLPSVSASTSSRPVAIAAPASSQQNCDRNASPSTDFLLSARSATPTSNALFALTASVQNMPSSNSVGRSSNVNGGVGEDFEHGVGPMTPRNDAGPFVLDGGSSRNGDGS